MSDTGGLFGPIFTSDELLAATGAEAWMRALLDTEAALAAAEADLGVIPDAAADAIGGACSTIRLDPTVIGRAGRAGGNPVIPLVAAVRQAVGEPAATWVHWGATSQDVLDTAAMVIARRAGRIVQASLAALGDHCAALAEDHRHTLLPARTLLQHAVPTTFGLKAAGWLAGADAAHRRVGEALQALAVQLGGAGGTLASLGSVGPEVTARLARRLDLAEPSLPWHAERSRVADLGAALGLAAGTAAKLALDVGLLMQTEVAEAAEPATPGRGVSSTMPHKRNPVAAAIVNAAARRAHALLPVLFGAMAVEHERAVGAWHAEWQTLTELLRLAGGAVAAAADTAGGLHVDHRRMRADLDLTGGLVMAEHVALTLAPRLGRDRAEALVRRAAGRSATGDITFAEALREGLTGVDTVSPDQLQRLLDPDGYLGAADLFIDRALATHRGHLALPPSPSAAGDADPTPPPTTGGPP